jgi:Pregnancy-associated plasma protein-A/Secretion system C-terminal sorting domain
MKKVIYLVLLLLPSLVSSQSVGRGRSGDRLLLPTTPRRYYSQKNYQRLLTLDANMARRRAFLDMSAHFNNSELTTNVTLPVVVHLLYKTGTSTANLPTETQIRQQLSIVSLDFCQTVKIKKHEADDMEHFADKNAMDTRISFCLASKTATGATTTGILTVPTSVTTWLADDKMKSATTSGSTAWDTEKYINIWVVNFPDSISGYAQMPSGPTATDGIVIDYRYFGKKPNNDKTFPYTEGKTLTHLMGTYLNLYELWSETVLCGDDGVDDTPLQNAPTLGSVDYKHISTCDGNPVVMTMNFMDNSNDEMQYMFTKGQKKRLHATLTPNGIRSKLVQSGATQCTNVPATPTIGQQKQSEYTTAEKVSAIIYRIYPNPAQQNINFEIGVEKGGTATLTIFNSQGSVQLNQIYKVNEGNQSFNFNCNNWTTGLYFVRLKINETVVNERVMIQK